MWCTLYTLEASTRTAINLDDVQRVRSLHKQICWEADWQLDDSLRVRHPSQGRWAIRDSVLKTKLNELFTAHSWIQRMFYLCTLFGILFAVRAHRCPSKEIYWFCTYTVYTSAYRLRSVVLFTLRHVHTFTDCNGLYTSTLKINPLFWQLFAAQLWSAHVRSRMRTIWQHLKHELFVSNAVC
jgi:hypothetical protein